MCIEDYGFFSIINWTFFDAWIKMIVPPLPALLTSSTTNLVLVGKLLSNESPPFGSIPCNQINDGIIFGLIP
jgi:hypothetical protein